MAIVDTLQTIGDNLKQRDYGAALGETFLEPWFSGPLAIALIVGAIVSADKSPVPAITAAVLAAVFTFGAGMGVAIDTA